MRSVVDLIEKLAGGLRLAFGLVAVIMANLPVWLSFSLTCRVDTAGRSRIKA
ncbi:MAG: hypothetical protein AAFQ90_09650 [Pseudomonadota bacterium]